MNNSYSKLRANTAKRRVFFSYLIIDKITSKWLTSNWAENLAVHTQWVFNVGHFSMVLLLCDSENMSNKCSWDNLKSYEWLKFGISKISKISWNAHWISVAQNRNHNLFHWMSSEVFTNVMDKLKFVEPMGGILPMKK